MIVYVDDILMVGPESVMEAASQTCHSTIMVHLIAGVCEGWGRLDEVPGHGDSEAR